PKNSEEISKIVDNVTKNYTVQISDEQKEEIKALMVNINDLDIDYDNVKDTLKNIGNQISDALKKSGKDIQDSGFFQGLFDAIGNFFSEIFSCIESLFNK
ncbi:DUF1002 domain-containing protein, partial [Clostridium perfringens]|uniref:DUF1002 domain-containing protein n=1 Tax=Clostridium perfringens TaxID=1502 RepID=UPI002ACE3FF6